MPKEVALTLGLRRPRPESSRAHVPVALFYALVPFSFLSAVLGSCNTEVLLFLVALQSRVVDRTTNTTISSRCGHCISDCSSPRELPCEPRPQHQVLRALISAFVLTCELHYRDH